MSSLVMRLTHKEGAGKILIAPGAFESATLAESGKATAVHTRSAYYTVAEDLEAVYAEYDRAVTALLVFGVKVAKQEPLV